METAALKKFAQSARSSLKKQVASKLAQVLAKDSAARRESPAAVSALESAISAENKNAVIDRVAYTWFNRFCALRFMDANGYTRIGVVSPAEGHSQPEILAEAKMGHIDETMVPDRISKVVYALLDGSAPSRDPQAEAYRLLLVAACNSYHEAMPYLFERIEDYTELLMPDDLLSASSILTHARDAITDQVCENVEVIGWLYQFYISEKKDQVIGKVVASEDIPAATQLFTPNWIVKYMVQNSLGAQWLATHPDSPLKGQMEYYIEPAQQTEEVNAQLAAITPDTLNPEELTLIDPACGSGHILVEAYELFKAIYLERGYQQRDVAKLILEKNLFGLEICPRAAQLTGFALMMKARADDRRIFDRGVCLNVIVLQDSKGFDPERLSHGIDVADYDLRKRDLTELKDLFEYATTFGSLIQIPEGLAKKLPALKQLSEWQAPKNVTGDAETHGQIRSLGPLVQQAEVLAAQYDAAVANPPYMGSRYYCKTLKVLMGGPYTAVKADLYGAFTLRNTQLAKPGGRVAMVTIPNWMFLPSFEQLRKNLFEAAPISCLVHNGRGVWGSDFGSCSYVLWRSSPRALCGRFLRLFEKEGSVSSNNELKRRFHTNSRFSISNAEFKQIPGCPVAYWVSPVLRRSFKSPRLGERAVCKQGLATGDNDRFLRYWQEVALNTACFSNISLEASRSAEGKWVPYSKGGAFRKWYGNAEYFVDWTSGGDEIRDFKDQNGKERSRFRGANYYFNSALTWSLTSQRAFGCRYRPNGYVFDINGMSLFTDDSRYESDAIRLLNSKVASEILKILNPTMAFQVGDISAVPAICPTNVKAEQVGSAEALQEVRLTRADWNAYERSWDFQSFPLLTASGDATATLESSYTAWITQNRDTIAEMKRLEEENNRLFIDAYGLEDELAPDVPIEQITLTVNPAYRYGGKLSEEELWARFRKDTMQEFISYAVGCMFGRYALEKPGLILANQGETFDDYLKQVPNPSFPADDDNVIPILDGDWFADDITGRFLDFLKVTFGEEHFEQNLTFIEEALGKDLRKYFLKDFYTDHVKTYKKRPIYWLFSSPKGSFNALIYMHRYRPDTVSVVLNDYLREFRTKLSARKSHLEAVSISAGTSQTEKTKALKEIDKLNKVIEETEEFEREVLYPLATEQVEIDLDDGVKVNYNKFGTALKKIVGLSGK